jgi:Fur family ferric uptake transcriptional regulator
MTSQKLKIMQHLMSVRTHPTADEVYTAVKKDLPAISLATVYRNLNQLAEQGVILKLDVNGEFRFDGDVCNHQHCVCRKCGRISDVFQKDISDYALSRLKVRGFRPECVGVMFKGLCNSCR